MTIKLADPIEEIIAWAEAQAARLLSVGKPIGGFPLALAAEVGVQHVDLIRTVKVDELPRPPSPSFKAMLEKAGIYEPYNAAMAFGYAVCGLPGFTTAPILAHAFRRVRQYEAAGSIANFMREYISQIEQFGYQDAPYNVDARAHQHIRPIAPLRR